MLQSPVIVAVLLLTLYLVFVAVVQGVRSKRTDRS
jgi:hypothetical protein